MKIKFTPKEISQLLYLVQSRSEYLESVDAPHYKIQILSEIERKLLVQLLDQKSEQVETPNK